MSYILYGAFGSGAAPVDMALAEAGQQVEFRSVPLEGDHQLRDEYRAINPMGRIPTLILPDGTVLTETMAILVSIADLHPAADLLPPPGETARAVALRWMALLAGEFYPHVTRSDYPERFGSGDAPALRRRAREMGRETIGVIEAHAGLSGDTVSPFLLGTRFSAADIYLAVLSRWMGGREWTPAHCPRIEVLARAVAARPAVAPLWRKHLMDQE
jgi:GST-like protein